MRRLGIVDLGSNTARLVVYAYEPGRWFRLADQIRQATRLGAGLGGDGKLKPAALERAESALRLFAGYATSTGLEEVEVFGTSALRDAANRDELLERVRPLGLEMLVLSGEEEARLGVLAAANGLTFTDAWVIDLGGGSAQLSLMRGRRFVEGGAFPLGAVRLTEAHLASDPPKKGEVRALEKAVRQELAEVIAAMRDEPLPLVAMGGTLRNLARSVQRAERYPLSERLNGYFLRRDALEELIGKLLGQTAKRREKLSGIKADRADVIPAGALVYRTLLREAGLEGLHISGYGVREGALFRRFLDPPHLIADLRSFSVGNVLSHFAQPREHVDRVRHLARRLFDGLRPLHGLGEPEAELLDAAVRLQDIGLAVNYYRHDRHGAYLVSSATLNGFSHREQALLALLVRFHLKGSPRLGPFARLCRRGDKRLVASLAACLRLAEHLDRPRAGRVRDLAVEFDGSRIRVQVRALERPTVELWEVEQHREIFRRAFGRRLKLGTVLDP